MINENVTINIEGQNVQFSIIFELNIKRTKIKSLKFKFLNIPKLSYLDSVLEDQVMGSKHIQGLIKSPT